MKGCIANQSCLAPAGVRAALPVLNDSEGQTLPNSSNVYVHDATLSGDLLLDLQKQSPEWQDSQTI